MNEDREDRLEERLRRAARDYNAPPPTPRDRMWERIAAARAGRREAPRPRRRRPAWVRYPVAAAAVLLLGIAIGRWGLTPGDRGGDPAAVTATAPRPDPTAPAAPASGPDRDLIYRFAAAPVLSEAELLLTQFRSGRPAAAAEASGFSQRAAALLVETRLLLDSPAGENAELSALLGDLELVLARIVRLSAQQQEDERAWAEQNIEQRAIMPRLHASIPVGYVPFSL